MALLGWFVLRLAAADLRSRTFTELARHASQLAFHLEESLDGAPVAQAAAAGRLAQIISFDADLAGLRISIISADGTVLADSHVQPSTIENQARQPEVLAALAAPGALGLHARPDSPSLPESAFLALLVRDAARTPYIFRVARQVDAPPFAPSLIRGLALAVLVSALLTLLGAYLVRRRFTPSLRDLQVAARRFAQGDFQHRALVPRAADLAPLALELNTMAQTLGAQISLLRSQRNELHAVHQSMTSGLFALDLQQHILSANRSAEQLLQFDGQSSRGRLLHEVVREPDLHRFVDGALHQSASLTREFPLARDPDVILQVISQPLRDADDRPVGLLVLLNDVSQLRRLESIRTDFAASVSHELRTPITNIKGYVETMLDPGVDDPEQARQFLRVIQRNADRLAAIIEDLLALARLEQPDAEKLIRKEHVPVRRILDSVITQFENTLKERHVSIQFQLQPDLTLFVNTSLIEQALGNLLSNAIRYSPPHTTITFRARALLSADGSSQVELAIRDQGSGIAPQHLQRIFERFYRVDKARSREVGGTGLGLSIVKHIVRAHDGAVEVDSEVGRGSEFRLLLPAS